MSPREQYGVLFPRFWEGSTGRQIQEHGRDAVILAAYLASCRHANMLGLYELPLVFLERELPVMKSRTIVLKAFVALESVGFATFDMTTEHVWVRNMARIRLGLGPYDTLAAQDNRNKAVVRLYEQLAPNPFLGPFFDLYASALRLLRRRDGETPLLSCSKGLIKHGKGLEAPRKPEQVQVHQQVQEQDQEQATGTGTRKAAAAPLRADEDDAEQNVEVITALVSKELLPLGGIPDNELVDATKDLCAKRRIAYNGAVVRKAVESALHRRSIRA